MFGDADFIFAGRAAIEGEELKWLPGAIRAPAGLLGKAVD
jgi:hypothetical protein